LLERRRDEEGTKRDFSLREPTLSQERKGRKKRRLAPFEMKGKRGFGMTGKRDAE
jgi:hypothetical protein